MIQASEEQIKTTALDHHGLIAAAFRRASGVSL